MHSLAERVLGYIRRDELLQAGNRVGVAVSGGIDSVALLRLLLELRQEVGIVLSVVHFNHKLRGAESDADQAFVEGLARQDGLEFYCESGDVARVAGEEHGGVEAAARELRYGFFRELLGSDEGDEIEPDVPQRLKPNSLTESNGTAKAVPFPNPYLHKIVTGHTLDDQAETVLMRVIRGTGPGGLGGIYPRVVIEDEDGEDQGEIVRPLLGIRRRELEQYLNEIRQPWREDSSNTDFKFTRNRVRRLVLPLLEREFNPSVVENLAELAEIARDEGDYWESEISGWMGTVVQWAEPVRAGSRLLQIMPVDSPSAGASVEDEGAMEEPGEAGGGAIVHKVPRFARDDNSRQVDNLLQDDNFAQDDNSREDDNFARDDNQPSADERGGNVSVSRPWLLTEPRAVQRRVVKAIGEQATIPLEFRHVEEILRFAEKDGPFGKELSLPLGWKILREPEAMVFIAPDLPRQQQIPDYEYALNVPGRVLVAELGVVIEALRLGPGPELAEYNSQQLLRAESLPGVLTIRNWRAGDRFWPAHTKAAKKIKVLLQERHVSGTDRRLWPVAVSGDQIVWMRGGPVPASLRAKHGQDAVMIREIPLGGDEFGW